MGRHLVLLETSGNQRYIFATNKLRENVGASELTFRSCRNWVLEALRPGVREILATSGKAYLLADSKDAANTVIRAVTTKVLKEAPGLDLSGVSVPIHGEHIDAAIQAAHKLLAARRGTNPGIEARFRRLSVVAECATSGLPANGYDAGTREPGPRSRASSVKRTAAQSGIDRMRRVAHAETDRHILRSADHLDRVQERSWLAVVHSDGNGLGKVFLDFANRAGARTVEEYTQKLQDFSQALDRCTEQAFGAALLKLDERCLEDPLPVVPIVLGGDDMTVVMDGRFAIQFTIDFLQKFEELTGSTLPPPFGDIIPKIMKGPDGSGIDHVTACAGVAVVKPHFPFYAAYELAEELIGTAKKFAKNPDPKLNRSAFDFHILYDASGPDLDRIRAQLRFEEENRVTELVARPYLISADDKDQDRRGTAALAKRMAAIRKNDDDGRRLIPNSQLHDLRTALFQGLDAAEARLNLIRPRYGAALEPLLVNGRLFWEDGAVHRTALLDAIDLAEFWHGEGN